LRYISFLVYFWYKKEKQLKPDEKIYGAPDVAIEIKRKILAGAYSNQERLASERKLSERFSCARGTIRQALIQLEQQGLVQIKPGSGSYVLRPEKTLDMSEIDQARPLELIDARFALEPHICRLAVLQATGRDLDKANALLHAMEACGTNMEKFATLDAAFHVLLAETTENSILIWVVRQINSVRAQKQWERMRALTLTPPMVEQYNLQHRTIFDAISARHPEQAAEAMKHHLDTARFSLTQAVTDG
jgi:GntR family uxuAB operon transcriptional repressor